MNVANQLWSLLVDLNKQVDNTVERVKRKVMQTPPISREIVNVASIEVRWDNLPASYSSTMSPNSDAQWGNNIKRGIFTNKGARIYVREMGFEMYMVSANNRRRVATSGPNDGAFIIPYFRWNFMTSITQRQYADKRVSSRSLGRPESGSHLVFREPFILEPMETLTFECELLQYGGNDENIEFVEPSFVVNADFFGYREGM